MAETNIGVCVPLFCINISVYICHANEVESNSPPILKGVYNELFVISYIHFCNHSHNFSVNDFMDTNQKTFIHRWHPSILPQLYNYRLYSQLLLLSKLVNSNLNYVIHCNTPRFVEYISFSLETWEHLVGRLEGGDVVVRRHLKRVRCHWYPEPST